MRVIERQTQKTLALTRTQKTQIRTTHIETAPGRTSFPRPFLFSCSFCGLLRSREARLRVLRLPFREHP